MDEQTRIILALRKVSPPKRSIYVIMAALDKGYTAIYHELQVMVVKGMIRKVRSKRKVFYEPTGQAYMDALKVQEEEESVSREKTNHKDDTEVISRD